MKHLQFRYLAETSDWIPRIILFRKYEGPFFNLWGFVKTFEKCLDVDGESYLRGPDPIGDDECSKFPVVPGAEGLDFWNE